MRKTLSLLTVLISTTLFAQDYLITIRGDTIRGNISFQLNGKIEMANVRGEKRELVSSISTLEVVMKNKRYKPIQFNDKVLFMEIISEGYVSLLAFQQPDVISYNGRLLKKRDGKQMEVPGIGFKKLLSNYLEDAKEVVGKIQSGELGPRELPEILKQYNEYISNKTKTNDIIVGSAQADANLNSKTELLNALRVDVEKSDLPQKEDAINILNDWLDKIKNNKPVPTYLQKALKTSVDLRTEFLIRIDELVKP